MSIDAAELVAMLEGTDTFDIAVGGASAVSGVHTAFRCSRGRPPLTRGAAAHRLAADASSGFAASAASGLPIVPERKKKKPIRRS